MSKKEKTYTYRCGQKVELEKSPDEMVVRALPNALEDAMCNYRVGHDW